MLHLALTPSVAPVPTMGRREHWLVRCASAAATKALDQSSCEVKHNTICLKCSVPNPVRGMRIIDVRGLLGSPPSPKPTPGSTLPRSRSLATSPQFARSGKRKAARFGWRLSMTERMKNREIVTFEDAIRACRVQKGLSRSPRSLDKFRLTCNTTGGITGAQLGDYTRTPGRSQSESAQPALPRGDFHS